MEVTYGKSRNEQYTWFQVVYPFSSDQRYICCSSGLIEWATHLTLVAWWKKEFKENPEKAFSGPGHPYKDQAKVAELERMVGRLYAENQFLKKILETFKEVYCLINIANADTIFLT